MSLSRFFTDTARRPVPAAQAAPAPAVQRCPCCGSPVTPDTGRARVYVGRHGGDVDVWERRCNGCGLEWLY
jgi:hypothetical protein